MKQILIIEDEMNIRESVAELLELKGYGVLEAENGDSGLRHALENKPDLILCDIMMPGMNGHDVLTAIRNNKGYANVPFIFLTALSQKDDIRKGMNLGADDYLVKPFKAKDLYKAIETRLSIQEEREKENSAVVDPFQQKVINKNIMEPIQGLRASSANLIKHFNDYTQEEIIEFVHRLNVSLDKIERTTRNVAATQAIELSTHDKRILDKLTKGSTSHIESIIRSVFTDTATNCDRVEDIFLREIPEFSINIPGTTFKMIISELFFNAFKFSTKGTLVSVEGEDLGDALKLTISDAGDGMAPGLMEEFNCDQSIKNPTDGKYGLYVVKSLLHSTGNSMVITSNKNKGTSVILLLK